MTIITDGQGIKNRICIICSTGGMMSEEDVPKKFNWAMSWYDHGTFRYIFICHRCWNAAINAQEISLSDK